MNPKFGLSNERVLFLYFTFSNLMLQRKMILYAVLIKTAFTLPVLPMSNLL